MESAVEMYMRLSVVPPSTLVGLANRCLFEPASRALDAEIYCGIHHIKDGNDLRTHALVVARRSGLVLILEPELEGWVEVPPFTSDMKYAASLVPDGLYTISRDPRIVCSTALTALAITNAPPIPYDFLNERRG
ncbi:MAG: hypothetical protein QOJ15_5510 [Bradyrhizobium sp.]|nr:hypothetical protein [Bradyrhizobium sp.]